MGTLFVMCAKMLSECLQFLCPLLRRYSCENMSASCELCTKTLTVTLLLRIRFHICLKHTAFLVADLCLLADRRRPCSLLSLPPQRFMKSGLFRC